MSSEAAGRREPGGAGLAHQLRRSNHDWHSSLIPTRYGTIERYPGDAGVYPNPWPYQELRLDGYEPDLQPPDTLSGSDRPDAGTPGDRSGREGVGAR